MGISPSRLRQLGLVDIIIEEPLGGFHKNPKETFLQIRGHLTESLITLKNKNIDDLLLDRRKRFKAIGQFNEI